jgi:hypothetical protein
MAKSKAFQVRAKNILAKKSCYFGINVDDDCYEAYRAA